MMLSDLQINNDQIDYDIPPSICGYPCYFSLCVSPLAYQSFNEPPTPTSPSSTLPHPLSSREVSSSSPNRVKFENGLNHNNHHLFSEPRKFPHPIMSNTGEPYDIPQPHPRFVFQQQTPQQQAIVESNEYDIPPATLAIREKRLLPRSGSQELSRTNRHIGGVTSNQVFGSSTSLPSPISNRSSLEASVSLSSCDGSNRSSLDHSASEPYDIPPFREAKSLGKDSAHDSNSSSTLRNTSDTTVKNMAGGVELNYDIPPHNCSVTRDQCTYDVPKNSGRKGNERLQPTRLNKTTAISNSPSVETLCREPEASGLDLSLNGALMLSARLEKESLCAIGKLLELSSRPNWRRRENLEPVLNELNECCHQLKCVMRELEVFTDGVYINSLRCPGSSLNSKLYRLSVQLKDSGLIVSTTIRCIDEKGWTLENLASPEPTTPNSRTHDELDQLIACAPGLREDIKHTTSLVKSCGKLLFPEKTDKPLIGHQAPEVSSKPVTVRALPCKPPPPPVPPKPIFQARPLPSVPKDNQEEKVNLDLTKISLESEPEDYDYVSLETRNHITRPNEFNSSLSDSTPPQGFYHELIYYGGSNGSKNGGDDIKSNSNQTSSSKKSQELSEEEQRLCQEQIFSFYCPLLEEHNQNLRNAVNSLIAAINSKQLPKVYIGLSKFVVIEGQKMIFIGDTISRNVPGEVSSHVARCANSLCDSLKNLIVNTKKAANLYPSAPALQDLLDSIVQVSIHSDQLTLLEEQSF